MSELFASEKCSKAILQSLTATDIERTMPGKDKDQDVLDGDSSTGEEAGGGRPGGKSVDDEGEKGEGGERGGEMSAFVGV